MKTKNEIIEISNLDWSKFYEVKSDFFKEKGTFVYISERMKNTNSIGIRQIGNKSMIAIDGNVEERVDDLLEVAPISLSLNLEHFITYFDNQNILVESITNAYLVTKENLIKPEKLSEDFILKELSLDDKENLEILNDACTEEEVENAFVEFDHEIVYGIYFDQELVAATSVLDWGAFYDIGIITHPKHREKGLAKFLVYKLCNRIFKTDKIPLYRCEVNLFGSIGVAKSLGFEQIKETYYRETNLIFK